MPAYYTEKMLRELDAQDRKRAAEREAARTEAIQKAVDGFAASITNREQLFHRIRNDDVPFSDGQLQQAQAEVDEARQVLTDVILANK